MTIKHYADTAIGNFKKVIVTDDYSSPSGRFYAKKGAKGLVTLTHNGRCDVLFFKESEHLVKPDCACSLMLSVSSLYLEAVQEAV